MSNFTRKKKIAVFDMETANWIDPRYLGFYTGFTGKNSHSMNENLDNYILFEGENCVNDFMDTIMNDLKYRGYFIYAHYGCSFDFLFILDWLEEKELLPYTKMILTNGNILQLIIENPDNRNRLTFRDSGCLLPTSLKKLTKEFNVEHKKIDLEELGYSISEIDNIPKEILLDYLYSDCKGLYEVLNKFYEKIDNVIGIEPTLTLASTSMLGYRKWAKDNNVYYNTVKDYSLDLAIRKSFYGGRVEIFTTYGEDLYAYDINSMYPYIMRDGYFPKGKFIQITQKDYDWIGAMDKYVGFGNFEVESPNIYLPLLPYRAEKILFPTGNFISSYSFDEAKKSLELGYKLKFLNGFIAKKSNKLFYDFITTLYNARMRAKKNNDTTMVLVIKLLMNSLFGKFSERWEKESLLFKLDIPKNIEPKDYFLEYDITVVNEEPLIYSKKEVIHRPHFNIGIGSQITTLSRLKLYSIMEEVLKKGYKLYYCDTDCVHTNMPPQEFTSVKIDDYELGALALEHKIKRALYLAPKFYFLELHNGEVIKKHKGFKNINLPFDNILDMYLENEIEINETTNSICKYRESLKRKNVNYRRGLFLSTKEVKKEFKNHYDKRIVNDLETLPINISHNSLGVA